VEEQLHHGVGEVNMCPNQVEDHHRPVLSGVKPQAEHGHHERQKQHVWHVARVRVEHDGGEQRRRALQGRDWTRIDLRHISAAMAAYENE